MVKIVVGLAGAIFAIALYVLGGQFPRFDDPLPDAIAALPLTSGIRADYVESQGCARAVLYVAAVSWAILTLVLVILL